MIASLWALFTAAILWVRDLRSIGREVDRQEVQLLDDYLDAYGLLHDSEIPTDRHGLLHPSIYRDR